MRLAAAVLERYGQCLFGNVSEMDKGYFGHVSNMGAKQNNGISLIL